MFVGRMFVFWWEKLGNKEVIFFGDYDRRESLNWHEGITYKNGVIGA